MHAVCLVVLPAWQLPSPPLWSLKEWSASQGEIIRGSIQCPRVQHRSCFWWRHSCKLIGCLCRRPSSQLLPPTQPSPLPLAALLSPSSLLRNPLGGSVVLVRKKPQPFPSFMRRLWPTWMNLGFFSTLHTRPWTQNFTPQGEVLTSALLIKSRLGGILESVT